MADIRIIPALGAINVTGSADFRGTGASSVLFVSGSGNVGVGTTNPTSKLHVAGAIKATAVTGHVFGTSTDTSRALSILNSGLSDASTYAITLGYGASNNNQAELSFYLNQTGSVSNRLSLGLYNSNNTLNILGSGNVGIGTTAPSAPLEIYGQGALNYRHLYINSNEAIGGGITLQASASNAYSLIATGPSATQGASKLLVYRDGVDGGGATMAFDSNGRVGIGTTNPTQKLTVSGSINLLGPSAVYLDGTSAWSAPMLGRDGAAIFLSDYSGVQLGGYNGTSYGPRMYVLGTGEVGIGTASPTTKLHIYEGYTRITDSAGGQLTIASKDGASTSAYIEAYNTAASEFKNLLFYGKDIIFRAQASTEVERMRINSTGSIKFNSYGSGTFTGTAAYNLSVDSSGNIIETANPSLTGTGTANYVTKWSGTNALTNSVIYDNGTNVGIGTATLTNKFTVQGGTSLRGGVNVTQAGYSDSGSTVDIIVDSQQPKIYSSYWSGTEKNLQLGTYSQQDLLTLTTAGNVGIGTTSPNKKLTIYGGNDNGLWVDSGGAQYTTIALGNAGSEKVNFAWDNTNGGLGIVTYGTSYITLSTNGNERVRITNDGNVGIGITTPSAKLDVYQSGSTAFNVAGSQGQLFSVTDELSGSLMSVNDISGIPILEVFSDDRVVAGTFGQNTLVVNGSKVGIGTATPAYKLDVATGNDDAIKVYNSNGSANNGIALAVGSGTPWIDFHGSQLDIKYNTSPGSWNSGNDRHVTILSGGNVGIGSTAPSQKLDVIGTGRFIDTLYIEKGASDTVQAGSSVYLVGGSGSSYTQLQQGVGRFTIWGFNGSGWGETLTIKNVDGNVGIGTTAPSQKLHLYASSGAIYTRIHNNNNSLYLGLESGGIAQVSSDVSSLKVMANTYTSFETSGSERMRITTDGNVGIGTDSPGYKLEVNGNIRANGGTVYYGLSGYSYISYSGTNGYYRANGVHYFEGDGFFKGVWDGNGNLGVGTTNPIVKLVVVDSSGSVFFDGSGDSYNRFKSTTTSLSTGRDLLFSAQDVGTTPDLYIKSNGNVGIGTTSPASALHINGLLTIKSSTEGGPQVYRDGNNAPDIRLFSTAGTFASPTAKTDGSLLGQIHWAGYDGSSYITSAQLWGIVDGAVSTNAVPARLEFKTTATNGPVTRMTIKSGGNVLIGTSTDAGYKLRVAGNAYFDGAATFASTAYVAGDMTVVGKITAKEFHTTFVSASIIYQSGSTQFGNSSDDTHLFSGSIGLNGQDSNFPFFISDPSTAGTRYNLANKGMGFNLADDYAQLQLYGGNGGYIDFANAAEDYDARLIYYGGTRLELIYGKNIAITGTGVGIGVTNPSYLSHIYENSDVWHTAIGGDTGILRIGGQTSSGAVIQAWNPTTSAVRDIYLQRDGGNVGIGTTSPNGRLHISSSGGDGSAILRITGAASDSFNWASSTIYANLTAGEVALHQIGKAESQYNAGHYGYRHVADGSSSNMLTMGMFQADYLVNIIGTGNVGIGVSAPITKLHVATAGRPFTSTADKSNGDMIGLVLTANTNENTMNGVWFSSGTDHSGTHWSGIAGSRSDYATNWSTHLAFFTHVNATSNITQATEKMRITGEGSVGIGITTPANKLSIGSTQDGGIDFLYDTTNNYKNQIKNYWNSNTDSRMDFNIGRSSGATPATVMSVGYGSNVGIGLTNPSYMLTVMNSAGATVNIGGGNSNTIPAIAIQSTSGSWADSTNGFAYYYNATDGDLDLYRKGNSATEAHVMTWQRADGNVGIGTTAPSEKFHVLGGKVKLQSAANGYGWIYAEDVNHSIIIRGDRSGNVDNYTNYHQYGGTLAGGKGHFFYTGGALANQVVRFSISDDYTVFHTNNVGIGTSDPGYKLDVNGSAIVRSGLVVKYSSNSGEVDTAYAPLLVNGPSTNSITFDEENTTATLVLRGNADNVNLQMGTGGSLIGPYGGWIQASYDNGGTNYGYEALVLNPSGGNVGIGLTNPDHTLHVAGTVRATSWFVSSPNTTVSGAGPYDWIYLGAADGNASRAAAVQIGDLSGAKYAMIGGGYDLTFAKHDADADAWATVMKFNGTNANDGAPTVSIPNNLTVSGTITGNITGTAGSETLATVTGRGASTTTRTTFTEVGASRDGSDTIGTGPWFRWTNAAEDRQMLTQLDGSNGLTTWAYNGSSWSSVFTLTQGGNVGIGTTSPGFRLDVNGNAKVRGLTSNNSILQQWGEGGGSGNYGALVLYKTQDTGSDFVFQAYDAGTAYSTASPKIHFAHYDAVPVNGSVMTIDTSTGNVGIGNTSPGAKLTVVGDSVITGKLRGGTFSDSYIEFPSSGNTILKANNDVLLGYSSDFYVKQGGSVGIGTSAPGNKLHVEGGVLINAGTGASTFNDLNIGGINGWSDGEAHRINFVYGDGTDIFQTIESYYNGSNTGRMRFRNFFTNGPQTGILMTIHSNGNVGIGADDPSHKLHVVAGTSAIALSEYNSGAIIWMDGSNGDFTGGDYFNIYTPNETRTSIGYSGGEALTVTSGSYVGIGTTSPTRKLTVFGNGTLLGLQSDTLAGYSEMEFTAAGVGGAYVFKASAGYTSYGGAGAFNYYNTGAHAFHSNSVNNILHLTAGGNVGIGTASPIADGLTIRREGGDRRVLLKLDRPNTAGLQTALQFTVSDIMVGQIQHEYAASNYNHMSFTLRAVNGSDIIPLWLENSGNVGIGTTGPVAKLDVYQSGSTALNVAGSQGQLFSVTDSLSGSLMSVNDISGIPILEVFSDDRVVAGTFGSNALVVNGGSVGIGTPTPGGPLEIYKANTGGLGGHLILNNNGLAVANETAIMFNDSGVGGTNSVRAAISSTVEGSPYYGDLKFKTGASAYSSLNTRMTIKGNGSVGIGSTAPAYLLDVAGTIRATGDVIAYSDRRVKQDIVTLENSVELIQKLRGVSYKKIGESEEKIGVIAQEILEVLPQVVSKDENGMYSVAYGNMAGLFIEAIKQQQAHIDTLEQRIEKLEQLLTQKP